LPGHVLQNFELEELRHHGRNSTQSNLLVRRSSVIWSDGHFYDSRHGSSLASGCEASRNDDCDVGSGIDVLVIENAPAKMD
jgi:hypothetical protein